MPMRLTTQITIDQVILHHLHRKHATPSLSQVAIPSDSDSRIFEYFREHIENSLGDEQAKMARFLDLQEEPASTCTELLGGELGFVEGSQRLATRLHRIILGDRRISSGDLVVCLYQGRIRDRTGKFLALMKMDPGTGFRQVRRRDPAGRTYLTFEIEQRIMPTLGERLQKCAFIRPLAPRRPQKYDLLLLDRQVRAPVGPQVAKFFSEAFLGVEEVLTPRDAALMLYREIRASLKLLKPRVRGKTYEAIQTMWLGALQAGEVDLEALAQEAEKEAESEDEKGWVKKALPTVRDFEQRRVKVDRRVLRDVVEEERAREFEIWVGDHGLRVEKPVIYPEEFWSVTPPTKASPRWRLVIQTDEWKEVGVRQRAQPAEDAEEPPARLSA